MATVLVVDDEADIRELVRVNLSLDSHEVIQAADGRAALEAMRRYHPDVILLDVMMPGLDGFEVLGSMKADGDVADIPVVMVTARSDEMDRVRGGIEGAIRYLTKPFSVSALRDVVRDAIAGGPEPARRLQAQHDALARLARLEVGTSAPSQGPRPKLTRLEHRPGQNPLVAARQPLPSDRLAALSDKQWALLQAVATGPTVIAAADHLGVSRSNVYASLRRIARKLDIRTVPDLLVLIRGGSFTGVRP